MLPIHMADIERNLTGALISSMRDCAECRKSLKVEVWEASEAAEELERSS